MLAMLLPSSGTPTARRHLVGKNIRVDLQLTLHVKLCWYKKVQDRRREAIFRVFSRFTTIHI